VALPSTINDREYGAFVESGSGIPAKRVVLYDAAGAALLAAAALADATANPTVPGQAAYNEVFNGTTWDRQRDGAADTVIGSVKAVLTTPAGIRLDSIGANVDGATGSRYLGVSGALYNGAGYDRPRTATVFKDITATAITAGTALTIWTPAASKKFRLMGWSISVSAAASLIFQYGATPTTMFRTELLAAAGVSQSAPNFGNGTMPGAANDALKLDVTANATVSGYCFGTEE
jgi:hypothetical protein